ncbi:MAG: DUF45 domain-containing protein [Clostridia bacterium]|nr:DUF45 domain-containing protein [Clostridia bacterium]
MNKRNVAAAPRICSVGGIEYILIYKSIKNMYLRINRDGKITVTANRSIPLYRVEKFVSDNSEKIKTMLGNIQSSKAEQNEPLPEDGECIAFFGEIMARYFPLFKKYIGEKMPEIKVKVLKSAWGICHIQKHYITFNKRLMAKPYQAAEYVVLHELCHFAHPNHQKGFYSEIEKIMPDYKRRIAMLRRR